MAPVRDKAYCSYLAMYKHAEAAADWYYEVLGFEKGETPLHINGLQDLRRQTSQGQALFLLSGIKVGLEIFEFVNPKLTKSAS